MDPARRRCAGVVVRKVVATTNDRIRKRPAEPAGLFVAVCAFILGAYMLLDGIVAQQTGHYIGGWVGPWASIVQSAGIDPLSYTMRAIFVVYGITWFAAIAFGLARRRLSLFVMAFLTLWYVPVGTILSLCIIGNFLWTRQRRRLP